MHEIFEHTADLGIRIRADNLDALFADAARGLFSVMTANLDTAQSGCEFPSDRPSPPAPLPKRERGEIRGQPQSSEEVTFHLHGDDIEELFHDWLAELLYTFCARRLVLKDFQARVSDSTPWELTAAAQGEPIDPSRHMIEDRKSVV